jgi:hypothetical protein
MSQSDYIQYKKTQNEIRTLSQFNTVLEAQKYTNFLKYQAETTFTTSNQPLNQLTPTSTVNVFGMEKKMTNCPTFAICINTNLRSNRDPIYGQGPTCP